MCTTPEEQVYIFVHAYILVWLRRRTYTYLCDSGSAVINIGKFQEEQLYILWKSR